MEVGVLALIEPGIREPRTESGFRGGMEVRMKAGMDIDKGA